MRVTCNGTQVPFPLCSSSPSIFCAMFAQIFALLQSFVIAFDSIIDSVQ